MHALEFVFLGGGGGGAEEEWDFFCSLSFCDIKNIMVSAPGQYFNK